MTPTPDTPSLEIRPDAVPGVSDSAAGSLSSATNDLAFDLWRRLPAEGNRTISPASIEIALAMTWAGARGETAAQMASVLHLEGEPPGVGLTSIHNVDENSYDDNDGGPRCRPFR